MAGDYVTIEVNGREARQEAVSLLEHEVWGHFTAMQVRGGRTRGLGLHLSRLDAAHREIYVRPLGGREVCARIRHALGDRLDAVLERMRPRERYRLALDGEVFGELPVQVFCGHVILLVILQPRASSHAGELFLASCSG